MPSNKLELTQLVSLLPHRPPFLFIDRVIELEPGVRGVGVKSVARNESYLLGHFPEYPIMPGVLIVEACAQLAAIVMIAGTVRPHQGVAVRKTARTGYLASINRFKFMSLAVPGDQLHITVQIGKRVVDLVQVRAEVRCDKHVMVATGEIAVSIQT